MKRRVGVVALWGAVTVAAGGAWAQPAGGSFTARLEARCFAESHGASCFLAGRMYQRGAGGVGRDDGRAAALHQRGCEAGFAASCNELGFLTSEGLGVPRDSARGVALFQRACEGGSEAGCGNLGTMYATGTGVARDPTRAAPLLERGCNARHAASCGVLGVLYRRGDGVPQSEARASELLSRSCDLGMPEACTALGRSASATAEVGSYPAPPPVTAGGSYNAPPPVVAPQPAPAPPPRPYYRPSYRPPATAEVAPSSSGSSSVAFLGSAVNRFSVGFGYRLATGPSSEGLSLNVFSLSMNVWRGPVEFDFSLSYGSGSGNAVPEWGALMTGASLGLNLISAPRADRNTFSPLNLSAGVSALLSFSEIEGGSRFGFGPYVADTFYFTCALALRADWTPYLVGQETFGWQFGVSFLIAPRRSYMCN